ncbi:hypothetical protein [Chitinophaga sp.]|uniref:hypothetical protein n=1 Tax=Chitinophaga sp. TaxID=1869181 RepID=UPI0031D1222B
MIQRLGFFLRKWGNLTLVVIGVIFILVTIAINLRGITNYEYYDVRRYNSVMHVPLIANYCVGGLMILLGFKKEWISDIGRRLRRKKNV